MAQQADAPLVIHLDQLDSPQQFQTVHRKALQRLVEQVDAGLQRHRQQASTGTACCTDSQPWLESLQPLDQGHTSFIDGTRGAGKTTFLRAACRALCKELQTGADLSLPAVAQSTLCFLGLMDPSRVETGEKILLNVVRAVQRRVEHCTPCFGERARQDATQQFRATLEKLAAGLSLLRQDHDPLKDVVDAEVFVSLQLERVDEGEHLRRTFHTLLDHACHVLKADALVLAFDDADTSAHKGSEVMECLRKYLNSPRLVVLVAGDMELYAQLARRKMVENVGKEVEGAKPERQTQHHRMLDHLEEQYLLKVFPVQRRHRLVPLGAMPDLSRVLLQWAGADLSWQVEVKGISLEQLANFVLQNGLFVKSPVDLKVYRDYFLKLPIRSVLQVLQRCVAYLEVVRRPSEVKDLPSQGILQIRTVGVDGDPEQLFQREFTDAVRAVSLGGLYARGVDVDAIAGDSMAALCEAVFDLCVSEGDYDTAAYLRPQSTDENKNACFFALSAEVARLCMKRPDRMLRYLLQGPATVSLFGSLQRLPEKFSDIQDKSAWPQARRPSKDEFKSYMAVGRNEDAMNWAWHAAVLTERPLSRSVKIEPENPASAQEFLEAVVRVDVRQDSGADGSASFRSAFVLIALLSELFDSIAEAGLEEIDADWSTDVSSEYRSVVARTLGPPSVSLANWMRLPYGMNAVDRPPVRYPIAICGMVWNWWMAEPKEASDLEPGDWKDKGPVIRKVVQAFRPSAIFVGKFWTRYYFNAQRHVSLSEAWKLIVAGLLVEESAHHLAAFRNPDVANGLRRIGLAFNPPHHFFGEEHDFGEEYDIKSDQPAWSKRIAFAERGECLAALLMTMPWTRLVHEEQLRQGGVPAESSDSIDGDLSSSGSPKG